ncbi:CinY protein [Streptomyces blastmyceticus]|uniref:CinY protein n=1 Tax=Streptomyces blastmyceticus TaxID=68180 RepID=A0ABP3HSZ3_9ACTN
MADNSTAARRPGRLVAAVGLAASALLVAPAGSAHAFGTYGTLGQNHEHERITRAALACAPGASSDGSCFEPTSLAQLAGDNAQLISGKGLGAVGAPDRTQLEQAGAHCDNADYLDPKYNGGKAYPQSRDAATKALRTCIAYLQQRFQDAPGTAGALVDGGGAVRPDQVGLASDCDFVQSSSERRAKCRTILAFGNALHGVQDFYAHSNWTDRPDGGRPVGPHNPPGLNRTAPSPLFDLTAAAPPAPAEVPTDLSTGCFYLLGSCDGRIKHSDDMNKDNGLIDPATGAASAPTTPRGKVSDNFSHAVQGAVTETRRQWHDLRQLLEKQPHGKQLVCALTHDDPVGDCA